MSVTELMKEDEEEESQQQNMNSSVKEEIVAEFIADQAHQQEEYKWPIMNFGIPPYRTYHFSQQFRNASKPNNFLKGVKWSPDGSCFLTNSEDNILRQFTMPENGSDAHLTAYSQTAVEDSFMANLVLDEGESVYDFCWYPYMTASDPVSCVFATTSRDHPIHLWDATSGQLRCTYRAYDNMDEITAAFSVAFNSDGSKIFAGYNKSLRVFDIHRPGRDFKQYSTLQGNKEGQSGIISAIGFSPHSGMLATGSYNQTTAIYSEDNMELLYILHGQEGGITHVQFSKDGNYLYTGGRKDPYILCWDIRNTVETVYKSTESTNQRILFDIEPSGKHLATGGQDGQVHLYDLQTGQWVSSFQAASDTVNGFSFHPYLPMAATTSGQRRFGIPDENDDEFTISGDENCASVWSFSYDFTTVNAICSDNNNGLSIAESLDPGP